MNKIVLIFLFIIAQIPLWAEADLGRLVPLGFSVPEERSEAPALEVWTDGEKISLVPGRKPVLLYFWGSHIPGSVADLPLIEELSTELNCGELVFAPVNLNDEAALVDSYADDAGVSLPLYLFPEGPSLEAYLMKSVPSLWLIDKRGRVAAACEGSVPWFHPDLIRSLREFAGE